MIELLLAVKTGILTAQATWVDLKDINVEPDGQPPGNVAVRDFYCAIHGTEWKPNQFNETTANYLGELFSFDVTITKRIGKFASDRKRVATYVESSLALFTLARAVMLAVHGKDSITTALNTALGNPTYGFTTHPVWMGTDANPRMVGPDWFQQEYSEENVIAGMVTSVHFGGVERGQCGDSATIT